MTEDATAAMNEGDWRRAVYDYALQNIAKISDTAALVEHIKGNIT